MITILTTLAACIAMFVLGTLIEYVSHRLMHAGKLLKAKHAGHHREGKGQGWLWEFREYFRPAILPAVLVWFVAPWPLASGASLGMLLFAAFAAYAHQLQHERPELVFWMPRPVHALHHEHKMWHHDFGLTVDIWDRVFGTYRAEPWTSGPRAADRSWGAYLDIRWW